MSCCRCSLFRRLLNMSGAPWGACPARWTSASPWMSSNCSPLPAQLRAASSFSPVREIWSFANPLKIPKQTCEPNAYLTFFTLFFLSFSLSSLRVSQYFAAGGSTSHPSSSAPAEGAAHLLWDPWQHLFHNQDKLNGSVSYSICLLKIYESKSHLMTNLFTTCISKNIVTMQLKSFS